MERSFRTFDMVEAKNAFWHENIDAVNTRIQNGHDKDAQSNSGLTLVVGCPLPGEVIAWVDDMQKWVGQRLSELEIPMPEWRTSKGAFHVTVYGLLKPGHCLSKEGCDALVASLREDCASVLREHLPLRLSLQGFGLLGGGGIAVRVSESYSLTDLRLRICARVLGGGIAAPSVPGFVEREDLNQMIMGRLQLGVTLGQRRNLRCLADESRKRYSVDFSVDSLFLVCYEHEFLDDMSGPPEAFP